MDAAKRACAAGHVDGANQAGDNVAGVVAIEGNAGFGAFVEFEELPLGGIAIEMGHALADNISAACRQEEFQAFDVSATGELFALAVHPENAEGESGVDRGLSFLAVDTEHRERRLAHAQQAAGVYRTAGMLEVGAAADGVELPSGIVAQQHALQDLPVVGANGAQRGGGASIGGGANLKDGGLRLAKAQYAEAEHPRFQFGIEHAAGSVALVRPDVQHAFAFAGDGVARGGEVEDGFAVLDGEGARGFGEEGLKHPG